MKSSTQDVKPAAHSIATQTSQPPSAAAAFFIRSVNATLLKPLTKVFYPRVIMMIITINFEYWSLLFEYFQHHILSASQILRGNFEALLLWGNLCVLSAKRFKKRIFPAVKQTESHEFTLRDQYKVSYKSSHPSWSRFSCANTLQKSNADSSLCTESNWQIYYFYPVWVVGAVREHPSSEAFRVQEGTSVTKVLAHFIGAE